MNINDGIETFNCGAQQGKENKIKQEEQCHYIFTFKSNNPKPKDTFDVINVGLRSRVKEKYKRRKLKGHNGQWKNVDRD